MTRRATLVLALVIGLALVGLIAPGARAAEEEPGAKLPAWLEEVGLDGFLATSYGYNRNRPDSGTNQFRVFDFDDNTFKLDLFELVAQRAVSHPRDAGFRVDIALGSSVPRVSSSLGLFRTDTTADDIDVHQAFVSWIAPLGSGLRLEVGKFITGHGYEVIPGYDGWNDQATRSLLFGYAIPFTHAGARASYAFSPRAAGMVMVVNGWDLARDNNHSKSVGAQLVVTPAAPLTLTLSGMYGPERAGNDSDSRGLLDLVVVWKANGWLTLGANGDLGSEPGAVTPGSTARWQGFAGYARIAPGGRFALSLRGESFEDLDGARTGTSQKLAEGTITPELRLTPRLLVRGDLRIDFSTRDVFEKRAGLTDTQPTVLLEALYSF